mmetsp:Transcript_23541/g.65747  ORF Transcript_23541/g.65747 Transcript_23541/m.65747 type:complete len:84 (-) Transcript_23541:108-359(-)
MTLALTMALTMMSPIMLSCLRMMKRRKQRRMTTQNDSVEINPENQNWGWYHSSMRWTPIIDAREHHSQHVRVSQPVLFLSFVS